MNRKMPIRPRRRENTSRGFSLIEMLIATVILLVGLVGIAQLVPASILINQKGRMDSTSLVFAQLELDQMLAHKLNDTSFQESNGAFCASFCSLGDGSTNGTAQGNTVLWVYNRPLIDFSGAPVDNFSFIYFDLNDPFRVTYDVRWAVVPTVNTTTGAITGKRFFVGVRQLGGSGFVPAVTLDAMVEK